MRSTSSAGQSGGTAGNALALAGAAQCRGGARQEPTTLTHAKQLPPVKQPINAESTDTGWVSGSVHWAGPGAKSSAGPGSSRTMKLPCLNLTNSVPDDPVTVISEAFMVPPRSFGVTPPASAPKPHPAESNWLAGAMLT